MKLSTFLYQEGGWSKPLDTSLDSPQTLITVFGTANSSQVAPVINEINHQFPKSLVIGASTAGEILQEELFEGSVVVAIAKFHSTSLKSFSIEVDGSESSYENGAKIAQSLAAENLKAVFVLSDGLKVNGSKLTQGINAEFSDQVVVTGGLAADDDRFTQTWVVVDGKPVSGYITAIGFYGDLLQVSHGSKGGWDTLGVNRSVTKSENNVLYELDGKPALDLYKKYLGDKAADLPASGLLFPLHLTEQNDGDEAKVRTILGVNETENAIMFAGDIPEGSQVTLMKANFDRLIDGAYEAGEQLTSPNANSEDSLCFAISCVGRKLVLKQRTEEELEATMESMPENTQQVGFYSYGEISTLASGRCDLHNQTMTLTLFSEQDA